MPGYGGQEISPQDVLNQLLSSTAPVNYPGGVALPETEAQRQYADQPVQDAIREHIYLGTPLPSQIPTPGGGVLGKLGQALGIRQNTQPFNPAMQARAAQAQTQFNEAEIARKLQEAQSLYTSGGQQYGGEYMKKMASAVGEPSLAAGVPESSIGKGQASLMATQARAQLGQENLQLKQQALEQKTNYDNQLLAVREAAANGRIEEATAKLQVLMMQVQNQQLQTQIKQNAFEADPVRRAGRSMQDSIEKEINTVYGQMANAPLPEQRASLEQHLKDLQNQRNQVLLNMDTAKKPSDLLGPSIGAPAASGTIPVGGTSAPATIPKGLFSGGGATTAGATEPPPKKRPVPKAKPTPTPRVARRAPTPQANP